MIITSRSRPRDVTLITLVFLGAHTCNKNYLRSTTLSRDRDEKDREAGKHEGRNEVDSNHRLQPRTRFGSGQTPGDTSQTAGEYIRDLSGCAESNGKDCSHDVNGNDTLRNNRIHFASFTYQLVPSSIYIVVNENPRPDGM